MHMPIYTLRPRVVCVQRMKKLFPDRPHGGGRVRSANADGARDRDQQAGC